MTSSTVTLRIQELAEANGLTFEELSKASGVSVQDIQAYATSPVEITEETAPKLRNIANQLNVPVVDLVKPVTKREAFKLNILELLAQKGLTLEQLGERSGVHIAILAFYSTQPICKQKLNELESKNQYLNKVSKVLDCCVDSLKIEAELSINKICLDYWLKERKLTLASIALLTDLPDDFIDLIATQFLEEPLDKFDNNQAQNNLLRFKASDTEQSPGEIFCELIKKIVGNRETWVCKD